MSRVSFWDRLPTTVVVVVVPGRPEHCRKTMRQNEVGGGNDNEWLEPLDPPDVRFDPRRGRRGYAERHLGETALEKNRWQR